MSKPWEKVFFVGCFLTQGSSYISAKTYGIMHRLHHAHTDKEGDPHSPHFSSNFFTMMLDTRNSYNDIHTGKTQVSDIYKKNLPVWDSFEKITHNWVARALWGAVYTLIYTRLATQWWMYIFLPVTFAMGAFQGIIINWWAHKFGYRNFEMPNTSKNILPVDILFWGEAYHNNHHKFPGRANYSVKWFEFDWGYQSMLLLNKIGVIKLKNSAMSGENLIPVAGAELV
jgi:stearoyl-CoA desaturase (Delta-9 desaturase)